MTTNQEEVLALRGKLWENGFRPVAVTSPACACWKNEAFSKAGKNPNVPGWQERALLNPPDAVTAKVKDDYLNTGIMSNGLQVLDIDVDDAVIVAQIVALAAAHLGSAPVRVRADSPRCLYLYRATNGEPKSREIKGAGGKSEIRGAGVQFVAYGIHPDGVQYHWPNGGPDSFHRDQLTAVTEETVQGFLEAVAPLIGAEAPKMPRVLPVSSAVLSIGEPGPRDIACAEKVFTEETSFVRTTPQGQGHNDQLFKSAANLFEFVANGSLDGQRVTDALIQASIDAGYADTPSWKHTAMKTIESGFNKGMSQPRPLLALAPSVAAIDISALIPKPPKEWPAQLNADAYIGIAGDFIQLVAPETEGDPCALLIAFLTVVGSLIGRGAYLPVGPTHHYGNLFSVIIAESSKGRKGTVMAEAKRFATMIDPTIATRMLGGLSSGEGLIEAVRDARQDDAPLEQGKLPVAKVIDNGVADKRLLVTESEMGQALQAAGRDGNTLSAVLRMAWDGEQLRTLARSNKNICREPHISIFGNITLDELQRLLTSTDRTNGFANRFLWVCARRSQELPWGGSVNEAALQALAAKAAHVISIAAYYGKCGWVPDAASLWAREYSRLSSGRPGLSGAMSARAEAQTLRIALIYAILDGCNNVDVPHLRAALEVWRYCQDSVDYCFGGTMANTTTDRILAFLLNMPEGASLTQISNHFGRNKKSDELQRALAALKDSGKARSESRKTGGRAADIWFAC